MTHPRALYRDPVYDGATDPTVVIDGEGTWWMLYTQRRADHPDPGPGVAWVHGSRVGVARSDDGLAWSYVGTLAPSGAGLELALGPPPPDVDRTHWAPELIRVGDEWLMYLTEIDGVPDRWEGHERRIVEYRSEDLRRFRRCGPIDLGSDRVIDAAVARVGDRWRMWFKDEAAHSVTRTAVSEDLRSWVPDGVAIGGGPHEGPFVFRLGGWFWMIVDEWRGMAVYRSDDAAHWQRQGGADAVILGESDDAAGVQVGRHGMVIVRGDAGLLYYFTHPAWSGVEIADAENNDLRRSAVFRADVRVVDGMLVCSR
ncbi:hypothetical protein [Microbacterium sp. ZW T5_56]|uniref:hypothetical protein n=1 Tax=Microbacterium sp. ZW T5_56 TaxID=3378081 RepID=UPI003853A46C